MVFASLVLCELPDLSLVLSEAVRVMAKEDSGGSLIAIRDYAWTHFRGVGVGWYPGDDFVHMDPRPDDLAWTARGHRNTYHPSWANRIRQGTKVRANEARTGS